MFLGLSAKNINPFDKNHDNQNLFSFMISFMYILILDMDRLLNG
jgi:hypothetical protein